MPKFVASVSHRNTGKEEHLIREAVSEQELRETLSDKGLVIHSVRPADLDGMGPQFEVKSVKGRVSGPFGPDMLRSMAHEGLLTPYCSIRKASTTQIHSWRPAWKSKGLFPKHVVDGIRHSHTVSEGDDRETTQLKALKRQLDEGLIDEQDYRFKKAELLGTPYELAEEQVLRSQPAVAAPLTDTVSAQSVHRTTKYENDDRIWPKALVLCTLTCFIVLSLLIGAITGARSNSSTNHDTYFASGTSDAFRTQLIKTLDRYNRDLNIMQSDPSWPSSARGLLTFNDGNLYTRDSAFDPVGAYLIGEYISLSYGTYRVKLYFMWRDNKWVRESLEVHPDGTSGISGPDPRAALRAVERIVNLCSND